MPRYQLISIEQEHSPQLTTQLKHLAGVPDVYLQHSSRHHADLIMLDSQKLWLLVVKSLHFSHNKITNRSRKKIQEPKKGTDR